MGGSSSTLEVQADMAARAASLEHENKRLERLLDQEENLVIAKNDKIVKMEGLLKTMAVGAGGAVVVALGVGWLASRGARALLKRKVKNLTESLQETTVRGQRNEKQAFASATRKFAATIVDVNDTFELAIDGMGQGGANKNNAGVGVPDSWVSCPNRLQSAIEGMEMTHAVQMKALESHGVTLMPSEELVGQLQDPDFHEAVATVPTAEYAPNTIVEVVRSGYTINGALLRAARVLVAAEPPPLPPKIKAEEETVAVVENQSVDVSEEVDALAAKAAAVGGVVVKGLPSIHMVWKVPAEDEEEVDAYWKEHEEWMQASHTEGPEGDDSHAPRLAHFHIAKGAELEEPLNLESNPTGNVLYVMSETFVAAEGIETHMELGQYEMAEWFAKIAPYSEKYAVHMDVGSVSNFTSLAEIGTFPGIYQKEHHPISVHLGVDCKAYWLEHEDWMRETHVMSREGNDSEAPRLTSFNIRKGLQMSNPMDPESELTGNLLYIMSESFVDAAGITKHMELGTTQKAEWFAKIGEYAPRFQVHMDASTTVFTMLSPK